MNDTIYRQAAIEVASRECQEWRGIFARIEDGLKALPPAQPERHWIPCSERLPEDNQFVLMTIRRMDKHYNHKPFISVGYISWNQSLWWCAHDGDCEPNDVRVDAWMSLPKPYKEGQDD
jgi:hypothetical protein